MNGCNYTCTCQWIHTYMNIYTHINMCVYKFKYIHVHTCIYKYIHVIEFVYIWMWIWIHLAVLMYVCRCEYIRGYVCTDICTQRRLHENIICTMYTCTYISEKYIPGDVISVIICATIECVPLPWCCLILTRCLADMEAYLNENRFSRALHVEKMVQG